MQKIGRAVQRINHPDKIIARMLAAFFREYGVFRIGRLDNADNFPLGHTVNFAGIIIFTFLINVQAADIIG